MRILIQRVRRASVSVRNELVSRIGAGMLILVGIADEDTVEDIEWLVRKCAGLRIFDDAEGVMNLDIRQVGGEVLAVSQFTLMASTKKGNRPSYIRAAAKRRPCRSTASLRSGSRSSSADRSLRASSGPTCRWNSSMTAPSPSGWIRATGNNPLLQRFLPHRIPETTDRGNDTAARSIAAFRPFSVAWHNFGYPLQRQDACTDATPPFPAEMP